MIIAVRLDLVVAIKSASQTVTIRYEGGLLSSDDGPAYEAINHRKQTECRRWVVGGIPHRDGDLPACESGSTLGLKCLREHVWGENEAADGYGRERSPVPELEAKRAWYEHGAPMRKNGLHTNETLSPTGYARRWGTKDHRMHREGGQPAFILEAANGAWRELAWAVNGRYHRDGDKPAYITRDGIWHWYKNGKLHRDNNYPAWITTHVRRAERRSKYYIDGEWYRPAVAHSVTDCQLASPW